jgi:phytoene/squalene synthetase
MSGAVVPDPEFDLKRLEPARWMALRFVGDAALRAELEALAVLDHDWRRVRRAAANPLMGEIRLAWWRETLEAGRMHQHPALAALNAARMEGRLAAPSLLRAIDAHARALDAEALGDESDLEAFFDDALGGVLAAAVALCGHVDAVLPKLAELAGFSLLARSPDAFARPRSWAEASDEEVRRHAAHQAAEVLAEAQRQSAALPVKAFPAVAHLALAGAPHPEGLSSRLRLTWAVARGRI